MFTPAEATALVPRLEIIFVRLDPKLARLRELRDLVEDADTYYGDGLAAAPAKERAAYEQALLDQADLERSVRVDVDEILALGGEVKDLYRGLVDFPARIQSELAYLCWQRGEDRIGWWHTLEGGFVGRKALAAETER